MSGVKRFNFYLLGDFRDVVLASDYDRDTQGLRDDYSQAAADAMDVARDLHIVEIERDTLRAQVEAMRALMAEAVPALQHISDTAQELESFTLAERFRRALQAKP